jgi:hypothetical protein
MSDTKDAQKRTVGKPFVSGDPRANPGGRPRVSETNRSMLQGLTPKVIQRWSEGLDAERPVVVGNGPHAQLQMVPDYTERRQSGKQIWEALYGKPSQEITGAEGGPLYGALVPDMLEAMKKLAGDK